MERNPNRIKILRILNSNGPLNYSKLQSISGFKTERESGIFAYHLKRLLEQSLVTRDSKRVIEITNLGKLVVIGS